MSSKSKLLACVSYNRTGASAGFDSLMKGSHMGARGHIKVKFELSVAGKLDRYPV